MEKELVRSVVRAFYGPEHIILVDALVNHNALSLDDAFQLFTATSKAKKDIGTKLKTLKEGGLVSIHQRQETKPGYTKSSSVEYYFIDYRFAIDATKYRLHMLQSSLAAKVKPTAEKNEFSCPRCAAQWTLMDALDNVDPQGRGSGFLCKQCGNLLEAIPIGKEDEMDHNNPLSKFNKQFDWLVKMLGKIDHIHIAGTTGEAAVESKKEVPRPKDPGFNSLRDHPEMQPKVHRPAATVGLKEVAERVEITLMTEQENTAAAQRAAAERKDKIATQNQLPSWHTQSTVQPGTRIGDGAHSSNVKGEEDDKSLALNDADDKNTESDDDVVAAYKKMAEQAEQEKLRQEAEEDAEEDSEDEDDDDEDDFEDIEVSQPEAKKQKIEETDSAKASDSLANTPLPPENGTPVNGNGTPAHDTPLAANNVEESDEDEEFEEVI